MYVCVCMYDMHIRSFNFHGIHPIILSSLRWNTPVKSEGSNEDDSISIIYTYIFNWEKQDQTQRKLEREREREIYIYLDVILYVYASNTTQIIA